MKRRTLEEVKRLKEQGVKFHLHHINPRHNGGTDEPENLVYLTVEEHAQAHKELYEEFGRTEDLIAYQALSGKTTASEARRLAKAAYFYENKLTDKHRQKLRENNLKARQEGKLSNIGDIMRGKEFSEDHKQKLAEIARKREKVECSFCGGYVIKQMLARHHGEGKCNVAQNLDEPKTCKVCGEEKKLKDFTASGGTKANGHKKFKNSCKVCDNKKRNQRRQKNTCEA